MIQLTTKDAQERVENLESARELINEAIELIKDAVDGTEHEANVEAYTVAHLKNWANGGNPYDTTIPKIQEWLARDVGRDLDDLVDGECDECLEPLRHCTCEPA